MVIPSINIRYINIHKFLCQKTVSVDSRFIAIMPDIPVGSQIFDLIFHPNASVVYTGLLTGEVKAFSYDEQGQHQEQFALKPSKRSCRGLAISSDGSQLWAVGKGKSLQ